LKLNNVRYKSRAEQRPLTLEMQEHLALSTASNATKTYYDSVTPRLNIAQVAPLYGRLANAAIST